MPKPPIFRNLQLQAEFDQNGFVKMQLFSPEQVQRLEDFYIQTQAQHETVIEKKKFHATNDTDNAELINEADAFIKQVMMEEIDKHFVDYKTIAANYLLKQSSQESDLSPHQDLRFVDEEKFYSCNIWVATRPTTKQNGCLRFLKGSHLLHDTIRPLPSYPWMYENVKAFIPPYFTDVTTEIGECVVLNHACIHGSYPNLSGETRIAAILALIPKDADICHYFLPDGNPDKEVEKYAMTLEDFVNLKGGQRPEKAPMVEKFKHDFAPVDVAEFKKWLSRNETPQNLISDGYNFISTNLSALFKRS